MIIFGKFSHALCFLNSLQDLVPSTLKFLLFYQTICEYDKQFTPVRGLCRTSPLWKTFARNKNCNSQHQGKLQAGLQVTRRSCPTWDLHLGVLWLMQQPWLWMGHEKGPCQVGIYCKHFSPAKELSECSPALQPSATSALHKVHR